MCVSVCVSVQMLRYLFKLQAKDLSLNTSMISLGSCTMKVCVCLCVHAGARVSCVAAPVKQRS